MPSPVLDTTTDDGDWLRWNDIWRGMQDSRQETVLFTPGTPLTLMQFWQRAYFDDVWRLLGPNQTSARCLELGSGRGTTSMYLASRGCDVTLVDRSQAALQLARTSFRAHGLQPPRVLAADARATGLAGGSFDCIYNIGLLEHFDDPTPVLRESLRLLRRGGLLFNVIVPEGSPWRGMPIRTLLNPVGTALRLAGAAGRRLGGAASREAASAAVSESEMVRTGHRPDRYLRWMRELGETGSRCVPYNPYFSVYRRPWLERQITLRAYSAYLAWRRRSDRGLLLETRLLPSTAYLLYCRKGES
jgi:SAM-dependent methyltransferase